MRKIIDFIDAHQIEFILIGVMLLGLVYSLVFNFVLLGV